MANIANLQRIGSHEGLNGIYSPCLVRNVQNLLRSVDETRQAAALPGASPTVPPSTMSEVLASLSEELTQHGKRQLRDQRHPESLGDVSDEISRKEEDPLCGNEDILNEDMVEWFTDYFDSANSSSCSTARSEESLHSSCGGSCHRNEEYYLSCDLKDDGRASDVSTASTLSMTSLRSFASSWTLTSSERLPTDTSPHLHLAPVQEDQDPFLADSAPTSFKHGAAAQSRCTDLPDVADNWEEVFLAKMDDE